MSNCSNNRNGCRSCGCNNNSNSCGCNGIGGTNTGSCRSCGCNNNSNSCGCNGVGGTSTGGCGNRGCGNWWNGCNGCSGVGGTNTNGCGCGGNWRPHYPFPPQNSVCGTCPPGTRPCNQCNPWWNGCNSCGNCGNNSCGCGNNNCGCGNNNCGNNNCGNNNCGCGNNNSCGCGNNNDDERGTYAFFNSTGSTLTTGSIIPLRFVIGSGELGRGTTGGTVSLDSGVYSVEYSLNATAEVAGATITITPEYLGALHPEYSRSFTTTAADQTFDIAGSFVVNLPTDTTLSLNVTITIPDCETETATITGVNASMLIRRISSCNS